MLQVQRYLKTAPKITGVKTVINDVKYIAAALLDVTKPRVIALGGVTMVIGVASAISIAL